MENERAREENVLAPPKAAGQIFFLVSHANIFPWSRPD